MPQSVPEPANQTKKIDIPAERSFASGRYVVRRVLPEGGQKTVYVVHDSALDRECALALIKTDAREPQELERFRREARAMARLDHPNVVALHDIGEDGGRPFFVCQYIAGGDLRGALREAGGPLPIERTLSIAEDLCRALAFAHGHGIVHRDVKPANIWLTSDGAAKLGDFGLAIAAGQSRVTLAGSVVGTAAYMAPEQALGQPADARSDLYALGCVLYEMLTGRPPFVGDDALAVISQHINTAPVAPSWHNAEAPRPLEALTLRLLAKAPAERPASASEVAQELRRIRAQSAEEPQPAAQPATTDLRGLDWGRFVGRREELAQLKDALEQTLSGKGALVMFVGEPGIGKTRLAEEFAVHAELRGARVLSGRCYEGESSLPYRPFSEALRQHVRSRPDDELRRQLGPGAPEVATLISEVRQRFPDIEEAPRLEPEAERLRLFESVTEFLRNAAATNPIVLFLDDLHWADKPSLLLLQHVARNSGGDRLLIIGAYRDVELDRTHPLADALVALRRLPNYRRVLLRGLPEETITDLLTAMDPSEEGEAGRAALAQALHQETEGNPFFIREVLAHLIETGKIAREGGRWVGRVTSIAELGIPEGVREVVGRRLSRLTEGCNRMLTLASTMTGGFSWEELKAICHEPEARLLDLLEEALRAQIIAERRGDAGGRYDFTHALIRQTLYEELSTPRRVLIHRQIGEALERLYAGNIEPHLAELAHHFCQAAPGGDVDKAIDYARQAGDRANALSAFEEAARLYEMALQTMELQSKPDDEVRCRLLLELAAMQMAATDHQQGRETFRKAADLAEQIKSPELLARAALWSGARFEPGTVEPDLVTLLKKALDGLPEEHAVLRCQLLSRLSLALYWSDERETCLSLAEEAIGVARRSEDARALGDAILQRHFSLWVPEELEQRSAAADEAVGLGEESDDKELVVWARAGRLLSLLESGDVAAADAETALIDPLVRALPGHNLRWRAALLRAARSLLDGKFDEAEPLAQQAFSTGQKVHRETAAIAFGVQIFILRREQGRLAEVEAAARSLAADFPNVPAFRCALAFLYSELGREPECREAFEQLAAHDFADLPQDFWWVISLALLSEVCVSLGDVKRASVLYELLLPYDGRVIVVGQILVVFLCLGPTSRCLGLLASTTGSFGDALRHFEDALRLSKSMGARPWTAHTQHDYAKMLLSRGAPGGREKALELLEESLDTANELGMKALVEKAAALKLQGQDIDRSSS